MHFRVTNLGIKCVVRTLILDIIHIFSVLKDKSNICLLCTKNMLIFDTEMHS